MDKQYYEEQAEMRNRQYTAVELEDAVETVKAIKAIVNDFYDIEEYVYQKELANSYIEEIAKKLKYSKVLDAVNK